MMSPACSISIPDYHQAVEGTGDTFQPLPSGSEPQLFYSGPIQTGPMY